MKYLALLIWLCGFIGTVTAAPHLTKGMSIRDAEIEKIIKDMYLGPIFKVAGLNPNDLVLYIVVDDQINAFATSNTTIVIYTGLILKTQDLGELVGVLAHETGHIADHHLARHEDAIKRAQKMSLLGVAAGLLTGFASGRPDLGMAIAMGSQTSTTYQYLRYSQGEESGADQAALKYLNALCWPANGMETFFKKLVNQELLSPNIQDPYFRTHPMTQDRVHTVHEALSHLCSKPFPPEMKDSFQRLKVKLEAFTLVPSIVIDTFKGTTELNQYARSIAYYRLAQYDAALSLIKDLILAHPTNPFYYEMKGIILFESGKVMESIPVFKESLRLYPSSSLLMLNLAQSYISSDNPKYLRDARPLLEKAARLDPENDMIWYYLSIVYGRQKEMGLMALSLSERACLRGEWEEAKQQTIRALQFSKKGTPSYQRILDLKNQIEQKMTDIKKENSLL